MKRIIQKINLKEVARDFVICMVIGIIVGITTCLIMTCARAYAADSPDNQKMLIWKAKAGADRCAIYALGHGSIEVDCGKYFGVS